MSKEIICKLAGINDLSELPSVVVDLSSLEIRDEDGEILSGSRGKILIENFELSFDMMFGYCEHWTIKWTGWYTTDPRVIAMALSLDGPNPEIFTKIPEGKRWMVDEATNELSFA